MMRYLHRYQFRSIVVSQMRDVQLQQRYPRTLVQQEDEAYIITSTQRSENNFNFLSLTRPPARIWFTRQQI